MFLNKMETQFNIIWKKQDEIEGRVWVSDFDDSLSGRVFVYRQPKNKMEAQYTIKTPTKETLILNPFQDTYVYEKRGSLNFGGSALLKVGADELGYKYRSLIQFPNIKDTMPSNMRITKAYLKLYSTDNNNIDLEISSLSNGWDEYSTVWYGQPPRKKIIDIVEVNGSSNQYQFDVTDIVKRWYYYPYEDNGFLLKLYDETQNQLKDFSSREGLSQPQLVIEYFDEDLWTLTGNTLEGKLKVRRTEISDVEGIIRVFRHDGESLLDGYVHVKNNEQLEGYIYSTSQKSIDGKVIVNRTHYKDLSGFVFVKKENLYGRVKTSSKNDISGYVKPKPSSKLEGKVSVLYKDSIDGFVYVKPLERNDLQGRINVAGYNNLNGRVRVIYKDSLESKVNVIYKNNLAGRVRPLLQLENDLNGQVNVIYKTELEGRVKVYPVAFKGEVTVKALNQIEGLVYNTQLNEITGIVDVCMKGDMYGEVYARLMEINEMDGIVNVINNIEISKGKIYVFIM